ncbi:hypothetical protein HY490_02435 [Candidatus Woesearchaeota archaeon]|nr:hypothetical protein [Candidatus Woesearchaeota archaeon]
MTQRAIPSWSDYIKVTLFESPFSWMLGIGAVFGISYVGSRVVDHYFPERNEIVQKQAIGGEAPDVYIERDGVKYFSHVDGKDIADLVKESE